MFAPNLSWYAQAPFAAAYKNFSGSFHLQRKAIESAALQHVLGTFASPDPVENALPDFLHHVPLGLELRLGHDGAIRRDKPGLIIADRK